MADPRIPPATIIVLCQTALTAALIVDRWVHRVTGGKSLEAQIKDISAAHEAYRLIVQKSLDELHRKASVFQGDQQRRIGDVALRLERIDEHLRNTDQRLEDLRERRRAPRD